MPATKTLNSLRSEPLAYVSGWSGFIPALVTQTYLGLCVSPQPALHISYMQYHCIAPMPHWCSQGYRLSMIVDGHLIHVNLCISYIHHWIEHRLYQPCCLAGYAGFSIQAHFLNLVMAVLSLNSLCQFILCINNLSSWEVISFGVFNHLFCCLDHAIQHFSIMLCSIIFWPFPMLGFSLWLSHNVYQCLLIQISLAVLGRQSSGPVIRFIRWAMYPPILFMSFPSRMQIFLAGWPWLVISCMMSLQLAISWAAGLHIPLTTPLLPCFDALV